MASPAIYRDYNVRYVTDLKWIANSVSIRMEDGSVIQDMSYIVTGTWCLGEYIEALGWGREEQWEVFV